MFVGVRVTEDPHNQIFCGVGTPEPYGIGAYVDDTSKLYLSQWVCHQYSL